jgi:hypothetical protein
VPAAALFDLSLVPLPPAVLALYRQAVPACLHALASLVVDGKINTSTTPNPSDEGKLTYEELEVVLVRDTSLPPPPHPLTTTTITTGLVHALLP